MDNSIARFDNSDVISAINQLAGTIQSIGSCSTKEYCGDGAPISEDLDKLVNVLLSQIVSCVPRKKQHAILISHGLEEYMEELDECWAKYCELASADGCDING